MDPDFKAKIEKQKINNKVDYKDKKTNDNNLNEINNYNDNMETKTPNNNVKLKEDNKEEDDSGCC